MFNGEVFDLCFKNPLGIEAPNVPKPAGLFRRASACAFVETGPISFSDIAGIKEAVSSLVRYKPDNQLVSLTISKGEDPGSEDVLRTGFLSGFTYAYDFADFFVLDFASGGSSAVLAPDFIEAIIDPLLDTRLTYGEYKPLILKLSKDLQESSMNEILHYCLMNRIDGVEITGEENVRRVNGFAGGRLPIIAYGDIQDFTGTKAYLDAGASLVNLGRCPRRLPSIILKQLKISQEQ